MTGGAGVRGEGGKIETRGQKQKKKKMQCGSRVKSIKTKEASEKQPSDKVGARGKQCHLAKHPHASAPDYGQHVD